jgi:hypothetical protein
MRVLTAGIVRTTAGAQTSQVIWSNTLNEVRIDAAMSGGVTFAAEGVIMNVENEADGLPAFVKKAKWCASSKPQASMQCPPVVD